MKYIFFIIVFISTLMSCNSKRDKSSETEVTINPDAVVTFDVSIVGMTCTGCENTIKNGVSDIPGVLEVNPSYLDGRAIVKFDTTLTDFKQISESIKKSGYEVTGHVRSE